MTGTWDIQPEYAKAGIGSILQFHFLAGHVYLVMSPKQAGEKVKIFLDDKPITSAQSGKDVTNSEVILDTQRLYDLVDLKGKQEEHTLKLEFEQDGVECFAFTFG